MKRCTCTLVATCRTSPIFCFRHGSGYLARRLAALCNVGDSDTSAMLMQVLQVSRPGVLMAGGPG